MPDYVTELHITSDEFEKLYRGVASSVRAMTDDGRSIRFPARALVAHLQHDGVHGRFRVRVDANHRLLGIDRLKKACSTVIR